MWSDRRAGAAGQLADAQFIRGGNRHQLWLELHDFAFDLDAAVSHNRSRSQLCCICVQFMKS
jgi:hypothetical protein